MPKLNIVGAGTPTPTRDRWGTCFILEICGQRLMIECGPAATYKMHRMGIPCTSVHHQSPTLDPEEEATAGIAEVKSVFDGPMYWARDMMEVVW